MYSTQLYRMYYLKYASEGFCTQRCSVPLFICTFMFTKLSLSGQIFNNHCIIQPSVSNIKAFVKRRLHAWSKMELRDVPNASRPGQHISADAILIVPNHAEELDLVSVFVVPQQGLESQQTETSMEYLAS